MDRRFLLTIEQAADRVGRSTRTLRRWVSAGKIKYVRDGDRHRGKLLFDPIIVDGINRDLNTLYPS